VQEKLEQRILVSLVGDVVINRPDPASAFDGVRKLLGESDIRFANCEAMYSRSTERHPQDPCTTRADPDNFVGVTSAGFDILSFANNHALGGGYGSFFDTLELMCENNIAAVGAGNDLAEAMAPVYVERKGVKVGFVAYACVYYPGFEAMPNRPGVACLRNYTEYKCEVGQPGTQPIGITTVADPRDKAAMVDAVREAKANADAVVVSMHWGLHHTDATVADYEGELGRAAIDAGADIVFGHHQHILKGVEVYDGRLIVHGANQFVFDVNTADLERSRSAGWVPAKAHSAGRAGIQFDPEYPSYPFRPDARMNLIAEVSVSKQGLEEVHLRPCLINRLGQPEPLEPDTAEFDRWMDYMTEITAAAGLNGSFHSVGDGRVVVQV